MILREKQGRQMAKSRKSARFACLFALVGALFTLAGCSGAPSKEEQTKLDEQGKQTNEAAMQRMMQEQGRPGAMPGAGGAGTPAAGGMPAPGGTGAPVMPGAGGR